MLRRRPVEHLIAFDLCQLFLRSLKYYDDTWRFLQLFFTSFVALWLLFIYIYIYIFMFSIKEKYADNWICATTISCNLAQLAIFRAPAVGKKQSAVWGWLSFFSRGVDCYWHQAKGFQMHCVLQIKLNVIINIVIMYIYNIYIYTFKIHIWIGSFMFFSTSCCWPGRPGSQENGLGSLRTAGAESLWEALGGGSLISTEPLIFGR